MASSQRGDAGLRPIGTLFGRGTVAGLTDGQLLERFATGGKEASEVAFAALVDRHGPMVLRTCRAILHDEHDAQDAFQATFLILVRRGGSLWVRDSVGPWLHRVACHASARARRVSGRRKAIERRAAEMAEKASDGPGPSVEGLGGLLHEEIDRLPDRYRIPVVLCELEGRSQEEAARVLGCPVGTVKSRLSRAREQLRGRLTRRGLAPGAFGLGASAFDPTRATLPATLVEATIQSALGSPAADTSVLAIVHGVLRSMLIAHLKTTVFVTVFAGIALGGLAFGAAQLARPGAEDAKAAVASGPEAPKTPVKAKEAAKAKEADPYAWRSADPYEAPDFERYFPDDLEGGKALDALWEDKDKDRRPDDEVLRAVRRGLRRTTQHRTLILAWIGNRFIWGKSPQNPDAIELMYHAADSRGPNADPYGTRHYAVYFGLSVVQNKTPAILHTLVDLCIRGDDYNDSGRVAWGAATQRTELLSYLKPYLAEGTDPDLRERAVILDKVFSDAPDAMTAMAARTKRRAQAEFGDRLPEARRALRAGTSQQRTAAMNTLESRGVLLLIDDSYFEDLRAAADDPDAKVREGVARFVGQRWIWGAQPQKPEAIELELRLSKDEDREVRNATVYFGLSTVVDKGEDVVRRLMAMVVSDPFVDWSRIAWGLSQDRDAAAKVLDEYLAGDDASAARAARKHYREITGRNAPLASKDESASRSKDVEAFEELFNYLGGAYPNFKMKGIDWPKVGRELIPRAAEAKTEEQFGLLVLELVARLEDSHAIVQPGSVNPPQPALPEWEPGLTCLIDDRGRPLVYAVERGSDAEKAGVRPGMTVVSADGTPARELIDRWMTRQRTYYGYSSNRTLEYDAARLFLQQPGRGAKVALVLEDSDGSSKTVEVPANFRRRYLPRLPVLRSGVADSANVSWTRLDDGLGYIYVRRIQGGLEGSLDRALKELGDVKGLIIDVRGNSGGGFDTSTAVRNFDPSPENTAEPDRPRYKGPIALLTDERTISAGEGWASWFVATKRARVFGTTSAGASSRKITYTMSNGLYRVVVPVKAYTGSLDRPIERRGLEPDVAVRCNAKDLAEGKDTVVEAAAAWLRSSPGRG